jgi:hypothetical protein
MLCKSTYSNRCILHISRGHQWVTLIEFDNEVTKNVYEYLLAFFNIEISSSQEYFCLLWLGTPLCGQSLRYNALFQPTWWSILSHYVGPIPVSMFHEDGTMRNSCKSDLVKQFENEGKCNTYFQGAPMGYFDWIWQWRHQKSLRVPACFLWLIKIRCRILTLRWQLTSEMAWH